MVHFCEFLKTWSCRSNSVTRQVSFNRTKIGGNCQNSKIQMRHFGRFSNTVYYRPVHGNGKKETKPDTYRASPVFYHFLQFSEEESKCIYPDGKSIKKEEKKAMQQPGLALSRLLALFSLVSSFLVHLSLGQSRILCPINLGHQLLHDEMSRLEKMMMCILLANTF